MRPSVLAGTPATMSRGGGPEPLRPVPAHELEVAADAAARHEHRTGPRLEAPDHLARARLAASDERPRQHRAAHADDVAVLDQQLVHAVAEGELHEPPFGSRAHAALERLDDRRAGAPGQVEARHRVTVRERIAAAALGPAGARQHAQPQRAQPIALLDRRELDVGAREPPRVLILGPVEAGAPQPVRPGQLERVVDPRPCAAPASRRRTGRRATRTPARRVMPRAPARAAARACRRR